MGIGRVFTQPVAPPRKFRGAIDAALTLALGSVCAFALTLGPAPLNTVAASSAAAASFAGHFDPAPGSSWLPVEVAEDDADAQGQSAEDEAESAPPAPTPGHTAAGEDVPVPPAAQAPPAPPAPPPAQPPGQAKKAEKPPPPPAQREPGPPPGITASAAVTIVETMR